MLQQDFKENQSKDFQQRKKQYKIYQTIETESMVQDFTFNKDQLIAASDIDVIFYQFNEKQTQKQNAIQQVGYYLVYTLCLSKSGELFTGSHDSKIKKWVKKDDGNWECAQILQGHKDSVLIIILSNDQKTLFSRSRDKTIKIWKVINEQQWECTQTISSSSGVLDSLSVSPHSNLMAFGCKINLSIWHFVNEQRWRKYQTLGSVHKTNIESVCFILNGSQVASAAEDIKLWGIDPENQLYILYKVIKTQGRVSQMNYNEHSQLLYFRVKKKYMQIWKWNQGEFTLLQTIEASKSDLFFEEQQHFNAIQMSEDSTYLALKDNYNDFIQIYRY